MEERSYPSEAPVNKYCCALEGKYCMRLIAEIICRSKDSLGRAQWLNWLIQPLQSLASNRSSKSCPGCSSTNLTFCLLPRKTVGDGQKSCNPVPLWETQNKPLTPGFSMGQLQLLRQFLKWTSCCQREE